MTRIRTTLALAAVLALAGCASATPNSGIHTATQPSPSASAAASRHGQAVAEADRILGTFRPPAGALRLSGRPAAAVLLKTVTDSPGTPNVVDDVTWWSVAGNPKTVADAVAVPSGAHRDGSASSGGPTGSTYTAFFSWPVTHVLDTRQLQVETARSGGRTIIRVDAVVTWLPARPANTLVPATVRVVTVTYTPGANFPMSDTGTPVGPITSSDPAVVSAIATAVNQQPMRQPGAFRCPMGSGARMVVKFYDEVGGPVVATASMQTDGCATIEMSVVGGGTATLSDGYALSTKIAALMHMTIRGVQMTK